MSSPVERAGHGNLPLDLQLRFEAVMFDWDGTAVPDRSADASTVRTAVEELCALGMEVSVVSGTHVGNVDGQLQARPGGPGHLYLLLNRGSEVFLVGPDGPALVDARTATEAEEHALTEAAQRTIASLGRRGVPAALVSGRLNRRKVDLMPDPQWADPPKAEIESLVAAVTERLHSKGLTGLDEVVEIAERESFAAGVEEPRITSDGKHVEIGLTDKSDSARWFFGHLFDLGIGPGLVLIAGDELGPLGGVRGSDSFMLVEEAGRATTISVGPEPSPVPPGVLHLGGGPPAFLDILRDQADRRRRGEVPGVDEDPSWVLTVDDLDRRRERADEAVLTLADGTLGTRGSPILYHPAAAPAVVMSGVYDGDGPESRLLELPLWHRLQGRMNERMRLRRVLDMRTCTLQQSVVEVDDESSDGRALMFSSLARPGLAALRGQGVFARPGRALRPPAGGADVEAGRDRSRSWMRAGGDPDGVFAAAIEEAGPGHRLDRFASYAAECPGETSGRTVAESQAFAAASAGFDALLREHRRVWAERWRDADVSIEGDPELTRALRFSLFHLLASAATEGGAAVGARGLTGPAYRGHVFWDADVFVLPCLAATHPAAARAMLEYRVKRLPAALEAARRRGRSGARFPWESARSGHDVTPTTATALGGEIVAIRTGQLEEHIVADVAWAAAHYIEWTGDRTFEAGAGAQLLAETARYWASRVRPDQDGRGHLYRVIGPDEYHEAVDDNAFTNVMARWNLRRAAAVRGPVVSEEERHRWLDLADRLIDNLDPETGVYEQFAGFYRLEPLVIKDVAPRRPIVADMLLGRERVRGAQVTKQADVLMLHHLIPDEVAPGSLEPNLRFYEPRTAHGSSLSPGVHAALFARAGDIDQALEWLRLAARIDLEDLTGTTSGGVHLATLGTNWQALAYGFLGLRPKGGVLHVDPRFPPDWTTVSIRFRFLGQRVGLRVGTDVLDVETDGPIRVGLSGGTIEVRPPGHRFTRTAVTWEMSEP